MKYLFALSLLFFFMAPANAAGNGEDKSGSGYQNEHQKNQKNSDGNYLSDEKRSDGTQAGEAPLDEKQDDSPANEKQSPDAKPTPPGEDDTEVQDEDSASRAIDHNRSDLQYFGKGQIISFSRQARKIKLESMPLMTLDRNFRATSYQNQQGDSFLRPGKIVSLFGVVRNGTRFVTVIDYYPSQDFLNNRTPH